MKDNSAMLVYRGHRYVEAAKRYKGPALEKGKTSRAGGAVKPLMDLIGKLTNSGTLVPGESKLADIGAGAYSRNADALRKAGFDVYAYDPYNGQDADGWTGVAATPPDGSFDLVFSSYVLNVVPEYAEDDILSEMEALSPRVVHVVRNKDVRDMITDAIYRYQDGSQDKNAQLVAETFLNEFADQDMLEQYQAGDLYEQDMQELAEHGVPTSKGFQRIPVLDQKGYQKVRDSSGFKLYTKGL